MLPYIFLFLASFWPNEVVERKQPQFLVEEEYPQGYFIFPIDPGRQASLSGTFGDLRINHFHAGLDIRTGGREGKSVYAAADGYVSRIKVSRGGYGNALYITHPNGLVTVYGHLKEYASAIKKRLTKEQYEQQEWEVDLYFEPNELPVNKGEMVAISGNTGGSGGPHLHFEIRDAEENTLDPSMFGFSEVQDNRAPVIEYVSLRCMSKDARVNGEFGTFDFPVTLDANGNYTINRNISVWGDVGLELYTYDKSHTSPFRLGIKNIEVKANEIPTYSFNLDRLAFHNKLDMNLHTNYKRMVEENDKLHKAYFERGNTMDFYEYDQNMGVFNLRQSGKANISVTLQDSYKNTRSLLFDLNQNQSTGESLKKLGKYESHKVELYDSILKIITSKIAEPLILLDGNRQKPVMPAYENATENTYLVDLRDDFFAQYVFKGKTFELPVTHSVSPERNTIKDRDFEVDFENQLYHTLFLNIRSSDDKLFMDKDDKPLGGRFKARWRVNRPEIDLEKDKVYITSGRRPTYVGGSWNGDVIEFNPKEFSTYEILRDSEKPEIRAVSLNSDKLTFKISDGLSGIKSFECYINGEWTLMEYEYKNGLAWSEKKESKPFSGEIVFRVTDNCNNTQTFKSTL
ncbi:M23 family metallopeptidase [Jiulongibacter sediminis]|uniref:M23ase beta-sheet core domain-containing protein n=1 Tax=Jiulongibacter sediminis TaxID=1605367 RepID=A0A0P7BYF5_9BACT|nr:M23 family metallopeptidase [Jiulongibacter sediminis]KPM49533.1 hypothetical protein AFM12_02720 [Jiulongibacter sediminis]TBX26575.1 hypothetical protein TK44_02725 [Jiulongibacter sediminis]